MTARHKIDYLLGHSDAELERLKLQPGQLADEADWLLDRMSIQPGDNVLELGCGPRGILDQLAERVGPHGSVTGIDQGEQAVRLASAFVADRELAHVGVLQGDAADTGLPDHSFDAVFTRLVLVNVPNPERIVAEAARLVRPGGVVGFHEADFVSHLCEPPSTAWDTLLSTYLTLFSQFGIDLHVGRRVPGMLRSLDLVDVDARPLVHLYPPGHPRRSILIQFIGNVREQLIGSGLLDEATIDQLVGEVEHHLADPDTMVVSHLFIQTWARKPY